MTFYVYDSGGSGSPFLVADYSTVGLGINTGPTLQDYTFSIPENASVGAVIGTVAGVDANDDTLTYSIVSGNADGDLAINPATGQITVVNALDYNRTTTYSLTVQVSDGSLTDQAAVTINVVDVNDAPTISGGIIEVYENEPVGAVVYAPVIYDADFGDTLTASISAGNTDSDFVINPETGVVSLANALDYDRTPSYSLALSITDGALTTTTALIINLIDVVEVDHSVLSFDVLFPEIRAEIPSITNDLLMFHARQACMEFCRETWYWQETLSDISVYAEKKNYQAVVDTGKTITDVICATVMDDQGISHDLQREKRDSGWYYLQLTPNIIQLSHPEEMIYGPMSLKIALQPSIDATQVSTHVINDHYEALCFGIKARAFAMRSQEWYSPDLSRDYRNQFENKMEDARSEVVRSYSTKNDLTTRPVRSFY